LDRVQDRVVEVDAGGAVDDEVELTCECSTDFWIEAEFVHDQVSADCDDFVLNLFSQTWVFGEETVENLRGHHLLLKSLLNADMLLGSHHNIDPLEI